MLIWNFNGQGPYTPPGQVFTTCLGTAVAFSAGPAVAYAGLALANPATVAGKAPVKLVPLRVNFTPSAAVSGTIPWGLMKLTGQGTATNGGLSLYSGVIMSPGYAGTVPATVPVGQLGGTFSVSGGTAAGTGSNTLYWLEMCGNANNGTGAPSAPVDLLGFASVMPGETLVIAPLLAVTATAGLTWCEVPLNSGS